MFDLPVGRGPVHITLLMGPRLARPVYCKECYNVHKTAEATEAAKAPAAEASPASSSEALVS